MKGADADGIELQAFIESQESLRIEKRVLAYVKKVIRNYGQGYCCVSQKVIRKALRVRNQTVSDALVRLVAKGELIRFDGYNRNRRNPKPYYFLPNAELIGNPNKSLFISTILKSELGKEEIVIEEKQIDFSGVENWENLGRMELIEAYIDSGLQVTPLIELDKRPPLYWTKDYLRTQAKNQLLDFFASNPNCNVGCWMPSSLIAVDVDDADSFYELSGGEVFDTLTSTSGRGFHHWFLNTAQVGSGNGIRTGLDFKTSGTLMVLPPSVHKTGRRYEWANPTEPVAVPQLIKDLYETRESVRNFSTEVVGSGARGSLPFISKQSVIEEGQRYNQLFRLGRHLRKRMDADELAAELRSYNVACCKPPLDDQRMQKVIRDVRFGADRED